MLSTSSRAQFAARQLSAVSMGPPTSVCSVSSLQVSPSLQRTSRAFCSSSAGITIT
nr:MAG TPA: hypothetical protein [Caudoviricetes sp.]